MRQQKEPKRMETPVPRTSLKPLRVDKRELYSYHHQVTSQLDRNQCTKRKPKIEIKSKTINPKVGKSRSPRKRQQKATKGIKASYKGGSRGEI